jgi:hypothetical protein
MKLERLSFPQHPRPPQRELRHRGVFDSGGTLIGQVTNVYVDEEGRFRFVEVATGGVVGLGKEHRPVPIEAVADADPGSFTLKVGRRTVESVPTLGNPDAAPDGSMRVRISTMQVLEGKFDRVLHFSRNALLPATEMQPGFRGGMLMNNRDESTIVTATWWNSQERMEETARCAHLPEEITELARYLAGSPTVEHYRLETIPRRRAEPDLSRLRDLPRAEAMRIAMLEYRWDCATAAKMVDVVQGRYVQDRAGRNNPQSALTPEPWSAPEPWRYEAVGDDHLVIDADENEIARFGAERPARLCAAAPELLESAKEARDELSQYVAPWMQRLAARLDEAIKEAED